MSDDTTRKGPEDPHTVHSTQKHEIDVLKKRFPELSRDEIVDVVRTHGPARKDVEMELVVRQFKKLAEVEDE